MVSLSNTQRKKLVNKTFGIVQVMLGLGLPVEIGSLQFNSYQIQKFQKKKKKDPQKSFHSKYDKKLLMEIDLMPKGAFGKFTVGKISKTKEEVESKITMLKTN